MEITIQRPVKVQAKAIRIDVPVRYGTEDIPEDFPFRKDDQWTVEVDIDTGKIKDWPGLPEVTEFHMKVTDAGVYTLLGEDGKHLEGSKVIEDYVPSCIPNKYSDYLEFSITKDGVIKEWKEDCSADLVAEAFFPTPDHD